MRMRETDSSKDAHCQVAGPSGPAVIALCQPIREAISLKHIRKEKTSPDGEWCREKD
jgi:hypothetical protein